MRKAIACASMAVQGNADSNGTYEFEAYLQLHVVAVKAVGARYKRAVEAAAVTHLKFSSSSCSTRFSSRSVVCCGKTESIVLC